MRDAVPVLMTITRDGVVLLEVPSAAVPAVGDTINVDGGMPLIVTQRQWSVDRDCVDYFHRGLSAYPASVIVIVEPTGGADGQG